ncbi:substrate-binding domain-containing protein [Bifidobacterium bifidum]|uniref:substrate-binding domain-containing protein n=1 Tax=Bifidobacterium bifidum TaxID=1681 RepID=UPI0028937D69|nr:substrate-binding domain-containing protein [Bifidobacterium bifidum]
MLRFTADGVNVPGDVSVIGFDNTLIAPVVTPPITSIRIPRAQLGQVAVRRLLLMMISPMILLGGVPVDSGDAVRHIRVRLLAVYLGDDA